MLRHVSLFLVLCSLALCAQEKQDASNILHPSQSDMLVGTRVPRGLDWSAPTPKERWRVWWRGIAASPASYLRAGVSSGFGQLSNSPEKYGQGWDAYGKRVGLNFVTYGLQDTASQGLAAVAKYEMRYIQCKCTKVMPRVGHALAYNFLTYDQHGKRVLNWPSIVGGYGAGMLSSTYTPGQKWSAGGIRSGNSGLYFGFVSSLLQEFTPSSLFKKKPKKGAPAASGTSLNGF